MRRFVAAAFVLPVLAAFGGCGRSSIDEDDADAPDASIDGSRRDAAARPDARDASADARRDAPVDARPDGDAGRCSPTTCPSGCCADGVCVTGTGDAACGGFGAACTNCTRAGFDRCDTAQKVCVKVTPGCGAQNCGGCCDVFAGQEVCLAGTDPNGCGLGGARCQQCVNSGQICQNRACVTPPSCGPGNCAGCCANGVCVNGQSSQACGRAGAACADCTATGGQCAASGATGGECRTLPPPPCGAASCSGCCQGATCAIGTQAAACGAGGNACQTCGGGTPCQALPAGGGRCQGTPPPTCGPGTCAGCCQGTTCVVGTSIAACGAGGQACRACTGRDTCERAPVGGGVCTTPSPTCDAQTCSTGCCVNGLCAVGTQGIACGTGGATCQDCTTSALECRGQRCQPPQPTCGASSCPGCCANGTCQGGFLDTACGSSGNACVSCASRGTTCDVGATPRACRTASSTCPATYGGCPSGTSTQVPTAQRACAANVLQNGAAACSAGPDAAACDSFFQFVQTTAPACGTCLAPFRASFEDRAGIFRCLAPFVGSTCNGNTGCAVHCVDTSCAQCGAAQEDACATEVRQTQCQRAWNDITCVTPALLGQGAFCNPLQYNGNFGQWLEAVGTRYCLR